MTTELKLLDDIFADLELRARALGDVEDGKAMLDLSNGLVRQYHDLKNKRAESEPSKAGELPPLPTPAHTHEERGINNGWTWHSYSAEQMREYALAAISAAAPPSAQTVAQEREAFEKWLSDNGVAAIYAGDGQYENFSTQRDWEVWQARAALAAPAQLSDEQINLPSMIYKYTGLNASQFPDEYAEVFKLCRALLSAAQGKESGNG